MTRGRPKKVVEPNHTFDSIVFTVFASALQISLDTLDKNKWPAGTYQHLVSIERIWRDATRDEKTITIGEMAERFVAELMADISTRTDKIRNERKTAQEAKDRQAFMKREYGKTPDGTTFDGRWVLRDYEGHYIDHGKYRNDLLFRHGEDYDIKVQGD